jgi:aminoglycoside phosphotransferase family enzyme
MTIQTQPVSSNCALPATVGAMMRPEAYQDHPRSVELRQTHVSYVFLAGAYVYKIKKPVRLRFSRRLDARPPASTMSRRGAA